MIVLIDLYLCCKLGLQRMNNVVWLIHCFTLSIVMSIFTMGGVPIFL